MANKILTNLNLLQNELQNAVIQVLATDPASGREGQIYYNSTNKVLRQYMGTAWVNVGVLYNQDSTTGAVITGLNDQGGVEVTNVVGLTLTGYIPVEGGYVTTGMTLQQAMAAMDTAIKDAVAGGGEVNQNAWSNISVKKQSTATTAVAGATTDTTLTATSKTDTFSVASGNKWVDINGSGKQINIGHSLSGATAGTYGAAGSVAQVTVDAAGHVTAAQNVAITPAAIGAATADTVEAAQTAADNAQATAEAKVASVGATANGGITIGGTATTPTVGIKLDSKAGNAASLSADGLMVTIPEVDVPEYTITKLATATTGYLVSYQLEKDGVKVGEVINIPKDYLVKSASIKTSTGTSDPSGLPAGTKYIDFTVNTYDTESGTGTESHIYLNVEDLVDVYTAGNGIEISAANVVSAKVVAGNGLSVDTSGIKMGAASTTAAGAMSADDFSKLAGIEAGATNNEITLNGTVTKKPSFYAPTTAGTNGQVLVSSGTGAPTWQVMPEHYHKYTSTNAAITAVGGAFTWNITAATHGVSNAAMIVQLYEVASNQLVIADVTVNSTNYNVTITINDTNDAGSMDVGTYKVVIFG